MKFLALLLIGLAVENIQAHDEYRSNANGTDSVDYVIGRPTTNQFIY